MEIFFKDPANKWSTITNLPEESHRKIEQNGHKPNRNDFFSWGFKEYGCDKAHDGTHDADDIKGNRKGNNEWTIAWLNHFKSQVMGHFINQKKF